MVQQQSQGREAQVKGLALVMEGNARSIMGVYEHLLEAGVQGDVLDRLREAEHLCRELGEQLNRL